MLHMGAYRFIILFFLCLYASLADIIRGKVKRSRLLGAMPVFLLLSLCFEGGESFCFSIVGCLVGLGVFFLVYLITKKKLGLADVWFSGVVGTVLGPVLWYPAIGLACAAAAGVCVLLRKRKLPFIPFLSGGAILILLIFR